MLRRALVPAVLVALAACAPPPPHVLTDAEKTAIADSAKMIGTQMFAALNAKDINRLMSFYVPGDFLSADMGMMTTRRASIDSAGRAFWGTIKTANMTKESEHVTVLDKDNLVLATGWHSVMTDTAGHAMDMRGMWMGTFHRTDAGWKVIAENNSYPIPGMNAPAPPPARRHS